VASSPESKPDPLLELANSVADGDPIDWGAVESSPSQPQFLKQLRLLDVVGDFHRRMAKVVDQALRDRQRSGLARQGSDAPSTWGRLEILERIGEGSNGEVFRAWDPQLSRQVALKLLRDRCSDAAVGSTVIREASMMARVNHQHIATIYGADLIDGRVGIWMEFIHGRTLEQIVSTDGPFGSRETALIGSELCQAVAAVHRTGLVHRDLKAQNVMRERGGRLVLMDFGTGLDLTDDDSILGTAFPGTPLYAAPELLEGQEATPRSDIYGLGVLLFHMLTGGYPVMGRTLAEVRHIHWERRGKQLDELLPDVPAGLRVAIERATQHDPRDRYETVSQMAADLAPVLVDRMAGLPLSKTCAAHGACALPAERRRWSFISVAGAVTLAAITAVAVARFGPWVGVDEPMVMKLVVPLLPAAHLKEDPAFDRPLSTAFSVSPGGNRLAFVGQSGQDRQIYIRNLRESTAEPLDETDGASSPVFSPDGNWLAFVTGNLIRKVPVSGGEATTVTEVVRRVRPPGSSTVASRFAESDVYGIAWRGTSEIVFGRFAGGLWSVNASGGAPTEVTQLNDQEAEFAHRLPHVLPDAETVLFTAVSGVAAASTRLVAQKLTTGERRVIVEDAADGRYVETGHLVFVRQGQLMAVPFDPSSLTARGTPVKLLDGVMQSLFSYRNQLNVGAAQYAFSTDGRTFAYVPGPVFPDESRSLVWVDAEGTSTPTGVDDGAYMRPDVSPDGRAVLFTCWTAGRPNVCAFDFERQVRRRITEGLWPLWSTDGTRMVFGRLSPKGVYNLFWAPADGSAAPEVLLEGPRDKWAGSWSRDASALAYVETSPVTDNDIWVLSIKDRKPTVFLRTPAREDHPEFSPDGRWMAYSSNESGRDEVYITEYPTAKTVYQVSTDGGTGPVWSHDGGRVYYARSDEPDGLSIMSVNFSSDGRVTMSRPQRVISGDYLALASVRSYDISADGRRFLLVRDPRDRSPVTHVDVILNWDQELRALAGKR
jgi:Tol biopolymer transport system component